jgi:sec-independent protein translocase protein TatC
VTNEAGGDGARMSLLEHLTELRKRIIISVAAVGVGMIIAFVAYPWIISFLAHPYKELTAGKHAGSVRCPKSGCGLVATSPIEPFAVRLKVSTYGGVIIALPVWLWEVWRFITPGLHKREKRYAIPFLFSSIVLFLFGGFIAWWTFPKALQFLSTVGGSSITPFYSADKYLTLISLMILAFGASFEFPVLLVTMLLLGVIHTRTLRRGRRWAAVGITTFAAVITPSQDPYSLFAMAIPLYVFYEASILIGRIMKK